MNLGKVKSFLIVLFLGINIYLIATSFFSSRFYIDKDTAKNCVQVLESNSVTLDADKIERFAVNLRGIDTKNAVYTNDIVHSQKNGFKTDANRFSCTMTPASPTGNAKKDVLSFLKQNGFDTKYMHFSKAGENTWYITCKVKGYRIFDSVIKVTKNGPSYTLGGRWYEPASNKVKSQSKVRNTTYITSILINMLQNEEIMKNAPFEITSIDYGYLAGLPYGNEEHITATALPYYRIKDNKGNTYYYDAKSGEYLN